MEYTYNELINEWFYRSEKEKDYFTKFIFLFISFIAFLSRRYEMIEHDCRKKNDLKLRNDVKNYYIDQINKDHSLKKSITDLVVYLDKEPIRNITRNSDPWDGKLTNIYDWENLVEYWFMVRNNLFHGHKCFGFERDKKLVEFAYKTLHPLMKNFVTHELVWGFD